MASAYRHCLDHGAPLYSPILLRIDQVEDVDQWQSLAALGLAIRRDVVVPVLAVVASSRAILLQLFLLVLLLLPLLLHNHLLPILPLLLPLPLLLLSPLLLF